MYTNINTWEIPANGGDFPFLQTPAIELKQINQNFHMCTGALPYSTPSGLCKSIRTTGRNNAASLPRSVANFRRTAPPPHPPIRDSVTAVNITVRL